MVQATKNALCKNFLTLRDEAVLRLTFEGFRIDEVLSITLNSYNATDRFLQPTRSKGRTNASNNNNPLKFVALPEETCAIINRYIQTERVTSEMEGGRLSQYLFINLNSGKAQNPSSLSQLPKNFERCAKRAGLDASRIRTHNGRSTKVMEFFEHQSLHPEDNITDEIIRASFGWRSFKVLAARRRHSAGDYHRIMIP